MRLKLLLLASLTATGLWSQQSFPPVGGGGLTLATFASPPSSPATNAPYLFHDASATGICTGGGSSYAICAWSGSAWTATAAATGTGLGDPGTNGVVYRNGSGTSIVSTATQMSGPNFCPDAGSTGAYACNLSPVIASYVTGTLYWFKANTANTASASINFNAKGGLTIVKIVGGIAVTLDTGDILVGQWVGGFYDGTNFQMATQLGNQPSIARANTWAAAQTFLSTINKITFTPPMTAWTIQPSADNQTTIIPTGTLVNTGVTSLASLVAVGTIATGVWQATIVASAYGGNGVANTATHTLGTSNQNWATLGTGIVKNTTTTGAISDAASTDVIGLWTGTCSSATFLRGDGSCQTPSGSGTINAASQYSTTYYSGSGSTSTVSGASVTGLPYFSGSAAPVAAVASNIYGLWTGTCSSSTYLRGDGSCQTPSGAGTVTTSGTPTVGAFTKFTSSTAIANTNLSENADGSDNGAQSITLPSPAAPTFNASGTTTCNLATSNVCTVNFTGTGSTTTLAFTNAHGSGPYWLKSCQSSTGGGFYTFAGTMIGFSQPDTGAGTTNCTMQPFTYDGSTNFYGGSTSTPGSSWHGMAMVAVPYSNLPTCSASYNGTIAPVSDSTVNSVGAPIAGSGSFSVLGYCNGTNWLVGTPVTSELLYELVTVGTGGITANTLVCLDPSAPSQVVACLTSSLVYYGVATVNAAASTSTIILRHGPFQVLMDSGTATIGNSIILSTTTAGYAHDGGNRNAISSANSSAIIEVGCASTCTGTLIWVTIVPEERGMLHPPSLGGTGIANTATLQLGTANQNWATTGTGILKNTTITGAISNAASADVIGLFTGTCSSGTFLRGDGSCQTPSGGGSVFTGSTATASTGITGTAAAPIFSLSDQSVKSPVRFEFTITASTPVTGITINNKTAGAKFGIFWIQPSSGMSNVTLGAAVSNVACTVSLVASAWTEMFFEVAADGATVYVTGCSSNDSSTGWSSILTNSSATSLVTLATGPPAGAYDVHYVVDLHTPCTTGTASLSFAFGWTGNSARTLTTGSVSLGSTQTTASYMSGIFQIYIGSGNVTFTPTLGTSCATGTATWDGNVWVTPAN